MMFYHFLIVCQHFCICIIVCLLSCQCRQSEFIAQSLPPNRNVGDKYLTFQSLDARNLLSTNIRYNFPVVDNNFVVKVLYKQLSLSRVGVFLPFIDRLTLKCFFRKDSLVFMLIIYGETPVARMNCRHHNYIITLR